MKNLIDRYFVKRRNLLVDDVDVKELLIVLNDNLSVLHKGVETRKVGEHTWHVSLLATNDEWENIAKIIKSKHFYKISYERKCYKRI